MSRTPPRLTDRHALRLHRARTARAPVDFLHRAAAAEVLDRLGEVNRRFTRAAVIGPMGDLWRDTLAGAVDEVTLTADAEVLDLPPESVDLAVHALALHWADDPVGQLVQMRHALRPDGLMIAVLFGGESLAELRAVLAEAEIAARGGLSPRVAPMGEIRDLGGLLQRAGFALPVADSHRLTVTYPDTAALMRDLRGMGETNALAARDRRPLPRGFFEDADRRYRAAFPADDGPGRLRATVEFVVLTGWKPAPGQQKPLRPGSAQARLANALGVPELRPGDAPGSDSGED